MKKNILWGLLLILLAAYLIVSNAGIVIAVPFIKIIATIIMVAVIAEGIRKRNLVLVFLGLGITYTIYDEYLIKNFSFPEISSWIVIVSAILVGVGLEILLKGVLKKNRHNSFIYESNGIGEAGGEFNGATYDGDKVHFENNFGDSSKYVNSTNLRKAHVENNFGASNIFFDNAIIAAEGARFHIENNFGETNIYLPANCRVNIHEDKGFGNIRYVGLPNADTAAPLIEIHAEVNFGEITFYYK